MKALSYEISIVQLALKGTIETETPLYHAKQFTPVFTSVQGAFLVQSFSTSVSCCPGFYPISFSVLLCDFATPFLFSAARPKCCQLQSILDV
jgi:hypothetical protein